MHPASRVLIYILAALVIPGLSFFWVWFPAGFAVGIFLWQGRLPWQMAWRSRWLLGILVVGYGYTLPGEALWLELGGLSPSWQGLQSGTERAAHLLVLLAWLDILVLRMSAEAIVSGLMALMAPLRYLGHGAADFTARVALRLALTLKAVQQLYDRPQRTPSPHLSHLQGNLARLFSPDGLPDLPASVALQRYATRLWDVLLPLALLAGVVGIWFAGAR